MTIHHRYYSMWYLVYIFLFVGIGNAEQAIPDKVKQDMVKKVNKVRAKGCKCGRTKMKPVSPIEWSDLLESSARSHAKDMKRHRFFSHYSKDGKDIGQRLEDHGYKWRVAGENIGEGQTSFDQVLEDWIKSPTHCKMIMHDRVTQMGVAKAGKYWVQHFGKPLK